MDSRRQHILPRSVHSLSGRLPPDKRCIASCLVSLYLSISFLLLMLNITATQLIFDLDHLDGRCSVYHRVVGGWPELLVRDQFLSNRYHRSHLVLRSKQSIFVYCGQLNALEGFAWMIWYDPFPHPPFLPEKLMRFLIQDCCHIHGVCCYHPRHFRSAAWGWIPRAARHSVRFS